MNDSVDLSSIRARKARLARRIGKTGYRLSLITSGSLAGSSVALWLIQSRHWAFASLATALMLLILSIWYHQDLALLPATSQQIADRLSGAVLTRLSPQKAMTPGSVWHALSSHWHVIFLANHFLLTLQAIETQLSDQEADMKYVWSEAAQFASQTSSDTIEPGHLAAALLITSPDVRAMFTRMKLAPADITEAILWLGRFLKMAGADKPYFGGIGRDWANGFTPQLNRFGHNLSLSIERSGGHYGTLTSSPGVHSIKNAFSQGASAIALVGPTGIGKTSHISALAQLLLAEKNDRNLEHRQIVALNPSLIISSARHPGQLEDIVMTLMEETAHAGHIILFLDDAQLFFGNGPGSIDLTQILLPIVQSRAIQLVFAMTPNEYQSLKAHNSAFAALLTPVILQEPDDQAVVRILQDRAIMLESRHKVIISYQAIREAVRLSGRYEQEMAYPGKAVQLLEQSLPHATHMVLTAQSVQAAIEQTRGVKVGTAAPVEADSLLHLEETIHKRMINQARAVTVVANALRRARAGVSNPRRPIGSFLFLGPTGVGKTELAKAIASTYFGSESNMIRLDMSEYQQPEDVSRILSDGGGQASSLILSVRRQPFSVVLLDEIEKAHPNILNLLLQLLDEGQLTDTGGRQVSFKDCIVIATSNAGAADIREHIDKGEALESFEAEFVDQLIKSNQFRPELLNRFDEIVLFRPLNQEELSQVVALMMQEVNMTLSQQNITVELTESAARQIVIKGYDARLGARPMRRMLQRAVEDQIALRILRGEVSPGDHVVLDEADLSS